MATDLSQSLGLNIHRQKDYIALISTADRIDLVLYYLFITADRFTYDIGSKINDMSSATSDRLSFMDLTAVSLFFVSC